MFLIDDIFEVNKTVSKFAKSLPKEKKTKEIVPVQKSSKPKKRKNEMTTHKLAALLLKQPNVKVMTYIEEAEEYGKVEEVKFINDENDMPYAKGDVPELPEDGIVLIQGWVAS